MEQLQRNDLNMKKITTASYDETEKTDEFGIMKLHSTTCVYRS
jgi:hypothetical protein